MECFLLFLSTMMLGSNQLKRGRRRQAFTGEMKIANNYNSQNKRIEFSE